MADDTDLPTFPGQRAAHCPFDPPAEYTQWRVEDGLRRVNWNGHTVWAISRFEYIRAAMTDPRISAKALALQGNGAHEGAGAPDIFPRMDDPEHARLRRMLTKDFTVKRVNGMRPQIEQMANDFIDKIVARGAPANLVADYALPIPSLVISLLLGVPYTRPRLLPEAHRHHDEHGGHPGGEAEGFHGVLRLHDGAGGTQGTRAGR
jgi:cytochrome P450